MTSKSKSAWLFALLALAFYCQQTSAQAPPDRKVHRQSAGTLDASGWTPAKSTEGAFSVKLPLLFNDFTTPESNSTEPVKRTFVVGGDRIDGARFVAMRVEYREGAKAAKQYFESAKVTMQQTNNPTQAKSLVFGGAPAWEATICQAISGCGSFRYVLAGETVFMLAVEYPLAKRDDLRGQISTFFKSLKYQPLEAK
jgi:hypothetical protein